MRRRRPRRSRRPRKGRNDREKGRGLRRIQGVCRRGRCAEGHGEARCVVPDADIKLDTPAVAAQRCIIERQLVKDRTPLAYEHIREDDAVYRQRVWQEIDVHEKMNLPFVYAATEDNGSQRFINILLNAIKSGEITAFDANVDDRFTTPMTF
jgi:hypothetical protein